MSELRPPTFNRRRFLGTAAAGVGLTLTRPFSRRAVAQTAAKYGIALIGCGGMGRGHLGGLGHNKRLQVLAVCDVDQGHLEAALNTAGEGAKGYRDYREILARPDIDLVCIATPDHWHAAITIQALAAGKDVYVEKPLCHNVHEGLAMVAAARRYDRVVQVGTMQRASAHFRRAVEIVRSGRIGEVKKCRCWFGCGGGGSWVPDQEPPANLDWDRWLGPAPYHAYNPKRVHFVWRNFWDYGGGMMTDWGVHLVDIVHWGLGEDTPLTIEATGNYPKNAYTDVPEELVVEYDYPSFHLTWSQLRGQRWDPEGHGYGIMFYGSEGELFVDRGGLKTYPADRPIAPIGPGDFNLPRVRSHWEEFLDCVESRQRPTCDIDVGFHSTLSPLLGNIALRTGRKLRWDAAKSKFVDDPDADRLLSRTPREPYGI